MSDTKKRAYILLSVRPWHPREPQVVMMTDAEAMRQNAKSFDGSKWREIKPDPAQYDEPY